MKFWSQKDEVKFFKQSLKNFASKEQLFYELSNNYYVYIPKNFNSQGKTLQSRNSLIGKYTEIWCSNFFKPIAKKLGLFAVNGVIYNELGLTSRSNADLAFCKTNNIYRKVDDIKIIFEIKMSIVNNYKFIDNKINLIGDYKSHKGTPSILRSDSMLKAIGKAINIRVSGKQANTIPIIIVGNSPITENYLKKVDFLKQSGVIQGFLSIYPKPTENYIKESSKKGFKTFDEYNILTDYISNIVLSDLNFFSSMMKKEDLGRIITKSSKGLNNIEIAEKFLKLIT